MARSKTKGALIGVAAAGLCALGGSPALAAPKADLEARAKQLRELVRSGQPIDSSDIANSESMRRLTDQGAALRAQLAEQSTTLLDQHPRIKELRECGLLDHGSGGYFLTPAGADLVKRLSDVQAFASRWARNASAPQKVGLVQPTAQFRFAITGEISGLRS